MIDLKGVGVALITPFDKTKDVDFEALTKLLNHCINNGADYLLALGTTAETATLSTDEKQAIVKHIIEVNNSRLPIVLGIGGNDTNRVIKNITSTNLTGISAILNVTPYYNKPNQRGLLAHYEAVVQNSPLPIILYNVPGRTGVNLSAQTTLTLAHKYPNKIIGVKEASGDLSQIAYILRDRPHQNFAVISGDDNLTLPTIALGGDGVISVSANVFTKKFCQMIHSCLKQDYTVASRLNLELHEATDLLFAEGNPVGVKAALTIKNIIVNNLRLPLVEASAELYSNLEKYIEKYNI